MNRNHHQCLNHPNWIKHKVEFLKLMEIKKQERIKEYDKTPKLCKNCLIPIEYSKRVNNFCCHSCCAKFNNYKNIKSYHCKHCNKEITGNKKYTQMFCSRDCTNEYKYHTYIQRWKEGKEDGLRGFGVSLPIRKFLFIKYDNKCCKCGWNEINKISNKIPLQVNHIDGKYRNCKEENLELLCPNCHSLTHNFGALNKGNGRTERYHKPA